jgi:hypothetical protein
VGVPHDAPDALRHPALQRDDQAGEIIHGQRAEKLGRDGACKKVNAAEALSVYGKIGIIEFRSQKTKGSKTIRLSRNGPQGAKVRVQASFTQSTRSTQRRPVRELCVLCVLCVKPSEFRIVDTKKAGPIGPA